MNASETNGPRAAVRRLREIHALGRQFDAQLRLPPSGSKPRVRIGTLAERHGLPVQTARNYLIFARRYDREAMMRLCSDCLKYDRELPFTCLVRLLAVEPVSRRRQFQKAALRNGWTVADLNREIREAGATPDYRDRLGNSRDEIGYVRGKSPAAVESLGALRHQIVSDAARWRRILELLNRQAEIDPPDRPSGTRDHLSSKDLDRPLLGALVDLVAAWDKLEKRARS